MSQTDNISCLSTPSTGFMALRKKITLKVIVLGESGVGKTSLLKQYIYKTFSNQYESTIGMEFLTKEVVIDDRQVTLHIWDTSGQERFGSGILTSNYYRKADCCMLVYDVTDINSFKLDLWKNEFLLQVGPEDPDNYPFVVVANKIGMKKRTITSKRGEKWCQANNDIPYFETSARDGINVEEAFEMVARLGLQRKESDLESTKESPEVIVLDKQTPTRKVSFWSWCSSWFW